MTTTCVLEDCDRPRRSSGEPLCNKHYMRKRRAAGLSKNDPRGRTCSVDGCGRLLKCRDLCAAHYHRWNRYGDPLGGPTVQGEPAMFVEAVFADTAPREPNGCILWPYAATGGSDEKGGYPKVRFRGEVRQTCHVILEHFHGPQPTPDHTAGHAPHTICGSRRCIAPEHLSWQTMAEQRAQMEADRRDALAS